MPLKYIATFSCYYVDESIFNFILCLRLNHHKMFKKITNLPIPAVFPMNYTNQDLFWHEITQRGMSYHVWKGLAFIWSSEKCRPELWNSHLDNEVWNSIQLIPMATGLKHKRGWKDGRSGLTKSAAVVVPVSHEYAALLSTYTSGPEAYKVIICFGTLHLSAPNNKVSANSL